METGKPKSLLFTPIKMRGVTLKNRICVSPMCQYSAVDGVLDDWHLVHLGSRAVGGAGMVMVEATAVEDIGRITPGCSGLWNDTQIEPLARIVKFLKSQDCVPGIQIGHSGRKGSTVSPWVGRNSITNEEGGWDTVGASAIPFSKSIWKVPKEADLDDINRIKSAFISSTERALKAGFEVLELHFAHGYLLNTFLSPITNKRTDEYGGSFENRIRLALEIVESVRQILPEDFPLGVRISVSDYVENGWDVKQSVELAKRLKQLGVDYVDCSSGGVTSGIDYSKLKMENIPASEAIQKEAKIATAAVGFIFDPFQAEDLLQKGKATLIMMARAFLDDPYWPLHAAVQLGVEGKQFRLPNQYDWTIGPKGESELGNWRQTLLHLKASQ